MVRGLALALVVFATVWCRAAEPVRVGVAGFPPFVSDSDGAFSGFSIDVWEQVATANGWAYEFVKYPTIEDVVVAAARGEVDVGLGETGITSARLGTVDFSQPYFRSGLQIMITDSRPHTLARLWEDLATWEHIKMFWVLVGIVLIATLVVAAFERKHNPAFPKPWPEALAESFYYVITLTVTGKSVYKGFSGVLGRIVLVLWTLFGVVAVAYLTSAITSVLTIEKLQGRINGPQDLPGKNIGVLRNSPAEEYLLQHRAQPVRYDSLEAAVKDLVAHKIPAIVGGAPLLQHYDFSNPQLPVTEVGPVFAPYNLGFAFPRGSPLRTGTDKAIVQLQESGELLDEARKYFGAVYSP
jgi:ABC-type amino acid transport substrate-binding protein